MGENVKNDTRRIRMAVAKAAASGIRGKVPWYVAGMQRKPDFGGDPNRQPPQDPYQGTSVVVSFADARQISTLAGDEAMAETGMCAVNVVTDGNVCSPLTPEIWEDTYRVVGSVTTGVTVGSVTISQADPSMGDPAGQQTSVRITKQPEVRAGYTTERGELVVPVMVEYWATTDTVSTNT